MSGESHQRIFRGLPSEDLHPRLSYVIGAWNGPGMAAYGHAVMPEPDLWLIRRRTRPTASSTRQAVERSPLYRGHFYSIRA